MSTTASQTFEEAHERHAHAGEGPRWVPIAAAVLAVLSAVSGYFGNLRSTQALVAKNDAIVATTHASDTFAQYQAGRIKYYIAQTALDQGVTASGDAAKLRDTIAREGAKGPPLLKKAALFEAQAAHEANARNGCSASTRRSRSPRRCSRWRSCWSRSPRWSVRGSCLSSPAAPRRWGWGSSCSVSRASVTAPDRRA